MMFLETVDARSSNFKNDLSKSLNFMNPLARPLLCGSEKLENSFVLYAGGGSFNAFNEDGH